MPIIVVGVVGLQLFWLNQCRKSALSSTLRQIFSHSPSHHPPLIIICYSLASSLLLCNLRLGSLTVLTLVPNTHESFAATCRISSIRMLYKGECYLQSQRRVCAVYRVIRDSYRLGILLRPSLFLFAHPTHQVDCMRSVSSYCPAQISNSRGRID